MTADINTIQCMVDIETYATSPDAVILSIGAVSFSVYEGIKTTFYVELALDSQKHRHTDSETKTWWDAQLINTPNKGEVFLKDGLLELSEFYIKNKCITIWAKGTDFDVAILSHAYREEELFLPWKYNAARDYRTLAKCIPKISAPTNPNLHNALADATAQASHLIKLLDALQDI